MFDCIFGQVYPNLTEIGSDQPSFSLFFSMLFFLHRDQSKVGTFSVDLDF